MPPVQLFAKTGVQLIKLEKLIREDDERLNKQQRLIRDNTKEPIVYLPPPSEDADDDRIKSSYDYTSIAFAGGEDEFDDESPENSTNDLDIQVRTSDAIKNYCGNWFPLPYDSKNPFSVRAFIYVTIEDDKSYYNVYLAIDTNYTNQDNRWNFTGGDLGRNLNPNPTHKDFCTSEYIRNYVRNVTNHDERVISKDKDFIGAYIENFSNLMTVCNLLAKYLPPIKIDCIPGNKVRTNLIIDFGNSRTCAVIMEENPDATKKPVFSPLPFVSYRDPRVVDTRAVDSRLFFSRTPRTFNGAIFPESPVFHNLSIARVGAEVNNIGDIPGDYAEDDLGNYVSSMSSPKRYLWDHSKKHFDWCFFDEYRPDNTPMPIRGDVLRYLPEGVANPFEFSDKLVGSNVPGNPNYSYKAGLIFLAAEILTQAYRFINDYDHRHNHSFKGAEKHRRILNKVLITYPTGMSEIEKNQLRLGVGKAVRLWHRFMEDASQFQKEQKFVLSNTSNNPGLLQPEPTVELVCDEAIAIQMTYLYLELVGTWKNMSKQFFDTYGKMRTNKISGNEVREQVIRIASIDIGGGTTDLAIADYRRIELNSPNSLIKLDKLFSHGVSRGGDDVQKFYLETCLLPYIINYSGIDSEKWTNLFQSENIPDASWQRCRRDIVSQIWNPMFRGIWNSLEKGENVRHQSLTSLGGAPTGKVVRQISEHLGWDGKITDVEVETNPAQLEAALDNILGDLIDDCAEIIAKFDCDLVILGGRITGHPWVRNRLVDLCPVAPDNIICLHQFPVVPNLYPFEDNFNRIADAKTCVSVGASFYHSCLGQGTNFRIIPDQDKTLESLLIGPINDICQMENPIFIGVDKSAPQNIAITGTLWLGEKRIDNKRVFSNPLWKIEFSKNIQEELSNGARLVDGHVYVTLERPSGNEPQKIVIRDIKGCLEYPDGRRNALRINDLKIYFQTTFNDEYWLDTGILMIQAGQADE